MRKAGTEEWEAEIMEWERELLELSERIGYRFRDLSYLKEALTHKSFAHEAAAQRQKEQGKEKNRADARDPSSFPDNEKMEFLGDALLGMAISEHLYLTYQDCPEGKLARLKSVVVSESILAEKASSLGLGKVLRLGKGERATGGDGRSSLLANALEAVIAAIHLDGGVESCRQFVLREFQNEVERIERNKDEKDAKSLLQEAAQARYHKIPVYRVRRIMGPDHRRTFEVTVSICGNMQGEGRGKSKKEAEQEAAREALQVLEE